MVIVGPTPPPIGGQSLMVDLLIRHAATFPGFRFRSVPTHFSRRLNQSGVFSLYKVWHLLVVIVRVTLIRLGSRGTTYLYFTPAGPTRLAILRDLVFLSAVRWQFSGIVLHFHAAGMTTAYAELPRPLRPVFRAAYRRPDLAIVVSPAGEADARAVEARRTAVVPNGVEDLTPRAPRALRSPVRLLYVGLVTPTKGVDVLVEALRLLVADGVDASLTLAGEVPDAYRPRLERSIADAGLAARVDLVGVVDGDAKRRLFHGSDVFCFLSHFESESFGMVLAEAMSAGLPVVGTLWRGIPFVLGDGDAGLLVPVADAEAAAMAIGSLVSDPELRDGLAARGRQRFEALFTQEAHLTAMRDTLDTLLVGGHRD